MPSSHTSQAHASSPSPEGREAPADAGPGTASAVAEGGPPALAPAAGQPLLRVERGHAEPGELAAVVVALLALAHPAGARPVETVALPAAARWNPVRTFAAPHSWQTVV
ncbi:acyl-CoA carboxylase epsilon subunit [Streptomyces sp. NPDC017673]|uniref:acyl-CoA carboxylase epsilon subunit n=1 Tax=unclassified Streptomyces TaxID=2593676 RepID=UPI00378A877F